MGDPRILTRVGEADRVEKLEIEEAKAEEEDDIVEEQNLPVGEIDLWK